ncbi:MAG TPA: lycopene cyclase domain-containing protein [Mycobacteriales bacterium]|nr:lycopene cyclase domain-containing protein [Mycobacteriales bacterium]
MTYTQLALIGVAGALLVDTVVLRTWLIRRRTYWTAYTIVVFFQLVTNGILTGFDIVRYAPAAILGWRIAYAPVEDLLFGYAMVTLTLSTWVWLGRRGVSRSAGRPARPAGRGTASGRRGARPPRPAPPTGPSPRR